MMKFYSLFLPLFLFMGIKTYCQKKILHTRFITKNIIEIKYTIHETINNLEYVFNIFTIWGIVILSINAIDLDNINIEFYYSKFIFQAILQLIGHIKM